MVRLPIAGLETADKLREPEAHPSNAMFGPEWGVQKQANGHVNGKA